MFTYLVPIIEGVVVPSPPAAIGVWGRWRRVAGSQLKPKVGSIHKQTINRNVKNDHPYLRTRNSVLLRRGHIHKPDRTSESGRSTQCRTGGQQHRAGARRRRNPRSSASYGNRIINNKRLRSVI